MSVTRVLPSKHRIWEVHLSFGSFAKQNLPILVFSYLADEYPYFGIIIFTPWQLKGQSQCRFRQLDSHIHVWEVL